MEFCFRIEADGGSETLTNYPCDGKAVLAFLTGLEVYARWLERPPGEPPHLDHVARWYQTMEQHARVPFFPACRPILDCMVAERPIGKVATVVRLLLDTFAHTYIRPLEDYYRPEATISDFRALLGNLELLKSRKAQVVRLNFSNLMNNSGESRMHELIVPAGAVLWDGHVLQILTTQDASVKALHIAHIQNLNITRGLSGGGYNLNITGAAGTPLLVAVPDAQLSEAEGFAAEVNGAVTRRKAGKG